MLLNEDYFDDLKLTDDDIASSDGIAVSLNNEYATPEEWFNSIYPKYNCFLSLNIQKKDALILTDDKLWNQQI
ncbi:MAG: hypothetical protein VZR53_16425 [Prevotella sp.]|nr:hypothetical protein [Prevotella sp.]